MANTETDEQVREKYRKVYKDVRPLSKDDFSNPTRDQKKELKKQEAKYGKIVVKKEEPLPTLTTYKYSKNGKGDLYESVLIGGQPCFITYNHTTNKVKIYPGITEKFRILYPAEPSDYSYPPYEFDSKEELELVHSAADKENLDTLLSKSESIVSKYNDQEQHKITSIASDVVWSYFQDRFATTRYEVLVGGVGSGKSALAATFGAIGYRPVSTTNPTPAILYRLLGNIEPGQCTMILEEAEKIDQVYEIMAILKTGYTRDGKVDRTNPVTLKPEFFHSFCFKIIVAERSPNQDTAKGVIDRAFVHSCFKGYPQHDIKEILNPTNTGGPEHKSLLKELEDFRKVLLLYRLIHFNDDILDMDIHIIGRDKELIKPTLQLFQKTESQDHLVETFQKILDLKNRRKATALHAALLSVASNLIHKKIPSIEYMDGKVDAYSSEYWLELPEHIKGVHDEKKPGEYHSIEFGTLYKGTVSRILQDNFGVESKHTKHGSLLTFDRHTIEKLETQLNGKISINTAKVTRVTPVTAGDEGGTDNYNYSNESERENSYKNELDPPLLEASHPSPPSPPRVQTICPKCGEKSPNPYWFKHHHCD